jgi:hypothetical protein
MFNEIFMVMGTVIQANGSDIITVSKVFVLFIPFFFLLT